MRIIHHLSMARLLGHAENDEPRSALLLNGQPTGRVLPGAVLEAAVEWQGQYLLFITDDVPYEEALRIVLIDAELNVVDSAELGGAYTTGSFSDLRLIPPDTVRFRFIGAADWTVRLLNKDEFRLPWLSEPRGVSRQLGFSRRFVIDGQPQPERPA